MDECEPIGALPKERCGDGARLTAALARLNSLIVVRGPAKLDEKFNHGTGRVIGQRQATMRGAEHEAHGRCLGRAKLSIGG